MQKHAYLIILLYLPIWLNAQSHIWIEGTVHLDKNHNSILDRGERRIKNIPVSNGKDIVYTDKKGHFRIQASTGQSVFPILPSGYTLAKKANEKVYNSLFLYLGKDLAADTVIQYNFGLITEKQPTSFRMGAIGDIQVGDTDEMNYAGKSIFRELAARKDIDFHLILGDLVNDQLQLLAPFKDMLHVLPSPSWTVLGNHDRNTEHTHRTDETFNKEYGASTYAFNYGGVHFIVLNNVYTTGQRSYEGRISDEQMQFLSSDLKDISITTPIVISQHIPMLYTHNQADVMRLLAPYTNVLILSGHTHQISRHFYNQGRVQEVVTGAPCGNWWTGEMDIQGIPDALMQCGSPWNYFVIDFNKNKYTLHYKGIGLDQMRQMDVTLRSDTLIANLYGASDSTTVLLRVDDADWIPMEHVRRPAESVLTLIENNKQKHFPASGKKINPLRRRASPHIWQATVPGWTPGTHQIHIRASDHFGYAMETTETIFIPDDKS